MARGNNTGNVIYQTTTSAGNVSTGETTLVTYSLPGGTIHAGYSVRVTAFGSVTSNANTDTIKAYFGSTAATMTAFATTDATDFVITGMITGITAASQIGYYSLVADLSTVSTKVITPSADNTAAIIIKITGTGGASNEIILKGMLVEILE